MTYYIEQDEKIVLFDADKAVLEETLKFMPQYAGAEIKETERPIVDFEWADTPEWEAKEAAKQKAAKKAQLIKKLDALDLKAIRSLRAIQAGVGTEADSAKLSVIESEAEVLRQELKDLED